MGVTHPRERHASAAQGFDDKRRRPRGQLGGQACSFVKAAELIDTVVAGRVLVYGSLPPDGRDLDLLVREPEERAIGEILTEAGFARRRNEWVRFARCSAEIVELTTAKNWALPSDEVDLLFGEGLEIDGLRNVVRPSPHHTLLILARRVTSADGVLDQKLRTRLGLALSENPEAWARARERADGWSARVALDALQNAWRTGARIPPAHRAAARRERSRTRQRSHGRAREWLSTTASGVPRPRLGRVVAFSGLDGAGKSSQADALRQTLARLGYDAIVVRTRITWDDALWTIAGPIKQMLTPPLRLLTSVRVVQAAYDRPAGPDHEDRSETTQGTNENVSRDPVTRVREASSLLTELWTLMITLANASLQWKLMCRHLLHGGIVVCDRYTLDSIVELRYSYGSERPFRSARAALSRLYPSPLRAYFLDVSPQSALERKGEWGIQWLSEHRDLYLQECERLGVRLLDGELPQADICDEVAREVWLTGI
jgi:thymidylate kinase